MKDIFEFKILINGYKFDTYKINSFIAFVEDHSIYWGGGYSSNEINGGVYADKNIIININDFIKEFVTFFLNLKISIDRIEINIEHFYFQYFEYSNFMKAYSSLPISIGHWQI